MSNRSTLILLLVVALISGGGRIWAGKHFERHEQGLKSHLKDYKFIWESVEDLGLRRNENMVSDNAQGYQTHFQNQAFTARMGSLYASTKTTPRSNHVDRVFTIKFEGESPHFVRAQIENFLFNSESMMPRMRTTTLELRPVGNDPTARRGIPSGSERPDDWKIESLVFTQRTPQASN